mgnify:CR=1 FL=1
MKVAKYIPPVADETPEELWDRQFTNYSNFRAVYFDVFVKLPIDVQYWFQERYHLDMQVSREEVLKACEEAHLEVPDYMKEGDLYKDFYTEPIYLKEPVMWEEV